MQRAVNLDAVRVLVNRAVQRGQTSLLQLGLAAPAADAPEAVILCLVDHPAISAGVISKLRESLESTHRMILIPTYDGQRGHPIVISQALFPELLALEPQAAANNVMRKWRDATQFVEVADAGIPLDVDDPAPYARLLADSPP